MKLNYQGAINRLKAVALAHPQINSADEGRELEFDTRKANIWPRLFIRTDTAPIQGGQGSVEMSVLFTVLLMDRLNTKRNNTNDVLNTCHTALTDFLATLNAEGLVRVENSFTLTPLYDYQDTQTSGWQVSIRVYLNTGFTCYPVP